MMDIITVTSLQRHGVSDYPRIVSVKLDFFQEFIQANSKMNIQAPHYWPFVNVTLHACQILVNLG